ncbi:MAG: bifunctional DNA-formamidopyrimidine glycosylase/DNA-(apurinic or apyrimidinic site) lyase [Rickettsiaceae bacterium]
MPELAEIETLKLYLKQHILRQKIVSYIQLRNNLRYELAKDLALNVNNAFIIDIRRRAKYLNIYLDNDKVLTYHLGMSGRLTLRPDNYYLQKHDHVVLGLANGKKLVFNDTRRFGMVYSCSTDALHQQAYLQKLGPEPLTNDFNVNYLSKKLCHNKSAIKLVLMNNQIVVGVGNIYAAESLFMAQINPLLPTYTITQSRIALLIDCIKKVLERAIEAGGTTLKDFVSGDNSPGYFQQQLHVYDRAGKPCYSCNTKIKKIKQSGRSTFFCPNCQKY